MLSYILYKTSLGEVEPTLMNPFLKRNLRISSTGVCLNLNALFATLFRIVRFGKRTPTIGRNLSFPTLYVRRIILLGLALGILTSIWRLARSLSLARIRSIADADADAGWGLIEVVIFFAVLFITERYVGREPFFKHPYVG